MNETTRDPAVNFNDLKLAEQIERKEIELAAAVPVRENGTPLLSMGRFMRALINTVSMVPKLLRADRRSFWEAASRAALDGLLPDGKEAALVPFEVSRRNDTGGWIKVLTVQYIPMIGGYRRLVREAGIDWQLRVVHQKDDFKHELGDDERIHHVPSNDDDPGPWTHVYAIAKRGSDVIARDVMNRAAVFRIRDRSEGWKSMMRIDNEKGERDKAIAKSAWGQWEEEMALKTVAKRQVKVLPLSTDSFIYDLVRREEAIDRGAAIRPQIASTSSLSDKMRALADQREQEALAEKDEDDGIDEIDEDGDVIDKETGEITPSAVPQTAADAPETKASLSSSQKAGQPDVSGAPNSTDPPTVDTAPAATPPNSPAAGAGSAMTLTLEQSKQLRKLHEILMSAQSQRGVLKGVTNFLEDMGWPEGGAAENAATILRDAHYRRIRGEGSPAECDKVRDQVTRT